MIAADKVAITFQAPIKISAKLDEISTEEGRSKTEIICRAIKLYAYVAAQGYEIEKKDGTKVILL
jgi:hypothetical protein